MIQFDIQIRFEFSLRFSYLSYYGNGLHKHPCVQTFHFDEFIMERLHIFSSTVFLCFIAYIFFQLIVVAGLFFKSRSESIFLFCFTYIFVHFDFKSRTFLPIKLLSEDSTHVLIIIGFSLNCFQRILLFILIIMALNSRLILFLS